MELKLSLDVVSQMDMMRIARELNNLNDFFAGAAARQPGTPMQLPKLSRLLDKLARENGYNLLEAKHREALTGQLDAMLKQAPIIHISFAADPPPKALEKILAWLRENIHPQILLQIGLQPNIAAGCVLRTANRSFDMSLRARLDNSRGNLAQMIKGADK